MDHPATCHGFEPGVFTLTARDGRVVAGLPFMRVRQPLTGARLVALPINDHLPQLCRSGWDSELAGTLQEWAATNLPIEVQGHRRALIRSFRVAGRRG